jgi:glycosyltransferase involved in cell wall biosynthesis
MMELLMDEVKITFSVVIPLYNKERHIARSILSVLRQRRTPDEILVIDDGSTDSGLQIVQSMEKDNPLLKIIKQKNAGVSCARNRGIQNATGNYISFLDADDEWTVDFLFEIEKLIKKKPGMGIYATSYFTSKDDNYFLNKKIISKKSKCNIINNYFKFAFTGNQFCASSITIPIHAFNKVGLFVDGAPRGEDLEMWCRISLKYDIALSWKPCAIYYQDSDNRSHISSIRDTTKKGNTRGWWVYEKFEEWLNNPNISKNKKRWISEWFKKRVFLAALHKPGLKAKQMAIFKLPVNVLFSYSSVYCICRFIKRRIFRYNSTIIMSKNDLNLYSHID